MLYILYILCCDANIKICTVTLVLPIPHPDIPEQHEPWCPLGKDKSSIFQSTVDTVSTAKPFVGILEI